MLNVSDIEVPLNKKLMINSNETKADSSSSVDNSCFMASLHTDTLVFTFLLHLPKISY